MDGRPNRRNKDAFSNFLQHNEDAASLTNKEGGQLYKFQLF